MRNVFAYIAAASVVSVSAPVAAESSELRLFQRLVVFHEQLLSGDDKRTNPKGLSGMIRKAKESSGEERIKYAKSLTFAELLEKAGSREEQEFLYSELCSSLKEIAPKFQFYSFLCPKTGKVWISKTNEVRNPYLIDERETGKLIS
ncbi:LIC13259/LIC11441 family protein [Leptospira haakeii]|uniref:Uncharacterized protein n=1 Tax=Leptospira haakeii TaxID=2023198 RepID=A0ABX4PMX6_9LEPT|nr:hypothetical protein [Leptospira haakeii]PKA17135.1 hypothetical protein CH363_00290 [Leptospira haakeii]PKA20859.1 hypothetical protein CH377_00290 [Leptospira haakeii]